MWKPFLAAASLASLAAFKTVSNARALDKSPESFNFPVIKAVAGANSPTGRNGTKKLFLGQVLSSYILRDIVIEIS